MGDNPGPIEQASCPAQPVPRTPLRRLTRFEYQNAVRDLLHVDTSAAADLPADELTNSFDNNAAVLTVSGPWLPARWRHWWWALLLAFVPIHLVISAVVPARSLVRAGSGAGRGVTRAQPARTAARASVPAARNTEAGRLAPVLSREGEGVTTP